MAVFWDKLLMSHLQRCRSPRSSGTGRNVRLQRTGSDFGRAALRVLRSRGFGWGEVEDKGALRGGGGREGAGEVQPWKSSPNRCSRILQPTSEGWKFLLICSSKPLPPWGWRASSRVCKCGLAAAWLGNTNPPQRPNPPEKRGSALTASEGRCRPSCSKSNPPRGTSRIQGCLLEKAFHISFPCVAHGDLKHAGEPGVRCWPGHVWLVPPFHGRGGLPSVTFVGVSGVLNPGLAGWVPNAAGLPRGRCRHGARGAAVGGGPAGLSSSSGSSFLQGNRLCSTVTAFHTSPASRFSHSLLGFGFLFWKESWRANLPGAA